MPAKGRIRCETFMCAKSLFLEVLAHGEKVTCLGVKQRVLSGMWSWFVSSIFMVIGHSGGRDGLAKTASGGYLRKITAVVLSSSVAISLGWIDSVTPVAVLLCTLPMPGVSLSLIKYGIPSKKG